MRFWQASNQQSKPKLALSEPVKSVSEALSLCPTEPFNAEWIVDRLLFNKKASS